MWCNLVTSGPPAASRTVSTLLRCLGSSGSSWNPVLGCRSWSFSCSRVQEFILRYHFGALDCLLKHTWRICSTLEIMRFHKTLQQTSSIATTSSARPGLLSATSLAHHRLQGRQRSFATTSAMAFSLDRSNTIGFIGLGAMGHHMVDPLTAPDHVNF